MAIKLATERLLLREWKDSDLPIWIDMNADSDVRRFFPRVLTEAESVNSFARHKEEYLVREIAMSAVEHLETGEFLGFLGLAVQNKDGKFGEGGEFIEIGWRFRKDYWGQGLATEGAKAVLKHGFRSLNLSEIFSLTSRINQPSRRVMEKIGLRHLSERDFIYPGIEGELAPHVMYSLTSTEYEK